MTHSTLSQTQQSLADLPGTWKLGAGQAITLEPRESGIVKIAHGNVWVTFDGPHGHTPDDSGDQIVGVGSKLRVARGQKVVMEAWGRKAPAYFSWDPVPVAVTVAGSSRRLAAVAQPLADLHLALVFGAGAAGRLAAALAQLVIGAISPPPAAHRMQRTGHARCA